MEQVDRFALFGCVFEIERCPASVRKEIAARLPPIDRAILAVPPLRRYSVESGAAGFVVRRARRLPSMAPTASAAAELLADDVELALSRAVEGRIFVHAGAVEWDGRAILVPGRSGTGKSEIIAALVRAGARYLSDEFAILDRGGLAHPYRRPIALRRDSGLFRIALDAIPSHRSERKAVPVGRIAFLRYRASARWQPRALSAGNALLGLLRNTLSCRSRLDDARPILRSVVQSAAAFATYRPDADETAARLLDEVS